MKTSYDAIVVGAGPNGLSAAVTLARAGLSVAIYEASETIGGGARSTELTLPRFMHDVCSAIHPLGIASPFFRSLPLENHGLKWIHPDVPLAHPFDEGPPALLERTFRLTGASLGPDAASYRMWMQPFADRWDDLFLDVLAPIHFPRSPWLLAQFGIRAICSVEATVESWFQGVRARGLVAGLGAHAILPLSHPATAGFALMLGIAGHAVGWPMPAGGSQKIVDALASLLKLLGGEIFTGRKIQSLRELPSARAILLDITPRQFLGIAGHQLPFIYKRRLETFRYGPGIFKMDWALDGPVPWKSPECRLAGTVHLGGAYEEIAASEHAMGTGRVPEKPFVLLAQQSLFDSTRAPEGKQTLWAYAHVPHGCSFDMTGRIEAQIERFAPGFRDRILARSTHAPSQLEAYNSNYIGGDISGGAQNITQLLTRPIVHPVPYATPLKGVYLCSSSTPPGGGVHGMCGFHAAQAALRSEFKVPHIERE
jgi:phytoene dehydrogenase-like protein